MKDKKITVVTIAFILVVSTFPSIAFAGNTADTATDAQGGDPDNECPASQTPSSNGPGCGGANSGIGDPIHSLTGNSYQDVRVYSGSGEYPIVFSWYYNSRVRPDEANPNFRGLWSHTYGEKLEITSENITLLKSNGRQIVFDLNGSSLSLTMRNSSSAQFGALTQAASGYTYKKGSRTYSFDNIGQLMSIENTRGIKHELSHVINGNQKTTTITHTNGQSIQLVYDHYDDSFPSQMIDSAANSYAFGYVTTSSIELLNSVTYPDYETVGDSVVQFQYLQSHATPSPDWIYQTALEAIIDEEGWQKAHWSYSPEGFAISNYLGDANEASEIYDITPVEAEEGSQHNAYIINPYGCQIRHVYHAYRKGEQFPVLPWLNLVQGADSTPGCEMIGVQKHYSKFPGKQDYKEGGLLESGHPNIFSNNMYTKYSGWDASINKNTEIKRAYLNDDGVTDTTVSRDVYSYHPSFPKATIVKRYLDDTEASLWQEIHYTYYDGITNPINNQRLKTKTVIDRKGVSNGNPLQVLSRTWEYIYDYHDANHKVVSRREVVDPRGFSQVTTYSPEGFILSTFSPASLNDLRTPNTHLIQYQNHTLQGQPQTVIDENGVTTQKVYNTRSWLMSSITGGKTTEYDYYRNGLVKRITNPGTDWTEYEYTTARRLKNVIHSSGERTEYIDSIDREVTHRKTAIVKTFAAGKIEPESTTTTIYDALGRVVSVSTASGLTTEYYYDDLRFRQKSTKIIVKGDSHYPDQITVNTYNPMGLLATTAKGHDPIVPDVSYEYDGLGFLTEVVDAQNHVTTYVTNGFNQVMALHSPDTGSTYYEYDASGNRITKYDADVRIFEYQFDRYSRLTAATFPSELSENIVYNYDSTDDNNYGIGRLTQILDHTGSTQLKYDSFGRIEEKVSQVEDTTYRWSYGYNDSNRLTSLQYPSGRSLEYARNPLSQRITAVSTFDWPGAPEKIIVSNWSHYPQGSDLMTLGNQLVVDHNYNVDALLDEFKVSAGGNMIWKDFTYNSRGEITDITDNLDASISAHFSYTEKNELDTAQGSWGSVDYDYDTLGNRIRRTLSPPSSPISVEEYNYKDPSTQSVDSNRLYSVDTDGAQRNFSYDAAGNINTDSRLNTQYTYSESNRLIKVMNDNGVFDYKHNNQGQRVLKLSPTLPSGGVHYHYSEDASLLGEYQRDGTVIKEYIYADGAFIAIAEPDEDADSDADGLDDDWELQHFGNLSANATGNPDSDDFNNLQEFVSGTNPIVVNASGNPIIDTDNDGLSDFWEQQYFGNLNSSAEDDNDGDGLSNAQEYSHDTDPDDAFSGGAFNFDTDIDGMPDDWEVSKFGTITRDGSGDFDNDGVSDFNEYIGKSSPTNVNQTPTDLDGDGLLDSWELAYFGEISAQPLNDEDQDGISNIQEMLLGTHPLVSVWKDYQVNVDIKSNDNDTIGFMFRYVDADNYYIFRWNKQSAYASLTRYVNGIGTNLQTISSTYTQQQTYSLEVIAQGPTLEIYIDGQLLLSASDDAHSYGAVAFTTDANTPSYFDNFTATNLTTGQELASQNFSDDSSLDDLIIVDVGHTSGPSNWYISGGQLVQNRNIWGSKGGTYALIDASVILPPDTDEDGLPDIWEIKHFGVLDNDAESDFDGDNIPNKQEYALRTDPTVLNNDTDGDGLADPWEELHFGGLKLSGEDDTDNDGLSNLIEFSQGSYPSFAVWEDYDLELDFKSTDNDGIGVMFRYIDENNYYRFWWDSQASVRRLERIHNGVFDTLTTSSSSYAIDSTYQLKITVIGDQLTVAVGGNTVFDITDGTHSYGGVALFSRGNTGSYFDNVVATNKSTNQSWLNYNFSNAIDFSDFTIVDEGTISGPSSWSISSGMLAQTSNIYGGNISNGYRGTYAVARKSIGDFEDGDSMLGLWEAQYFGSLNEIDGGDFDEDGLTNIQEFHLGTDPSDGNADSDGDSMNDAWELHYFGSLDASGLDDADNDGDTNADEFSASTYPTYTAWKDYDFELDIRSSDNDSMGVMFRYIDENNYYRFYWETQYNSRRLEKVEDGVFTTIASDSANYVKNATYQLKVSVTGPQLVVQVNGSTVYDIIDETHSYGGVALFCRGNASTYYDDIAVTNLHTTTPWITYTFDGSQSMSDFIIVDEGTISSPSSWSISSGQVRQKSNIYGGSNGPTGYRGTYAIITASIGIPLDSDNDALADEWEIEHFGNLVHFGAGDFDSDGISNEQEFSNGTDPTNPN